jgi:hypothetical protein
MSESTRTPAAELMRQLGFRFPTPASASRGAALAVADGARPAAARKYLHVTNGDSAAEILRQSGVGGIVTVTADVLHEGPAPGGLAPERWRKVRARYLAESGYGDYDSCLAQLTRWDRTLEDFRPHEEIVLWFEHDLFDQLLLIRALHGFAGRNLGGTELSLICIGENRPLPRPRAAVAAADGEPARPPPAGQRGAEAARPRRLACLLRP